MVAHPVPIRAAMRPLVLLGALLSACTGPQHDILVDLNTDLRPRLDFEHVRVTILEAPNSARVGVQDDFVPAADDDFLMFPGRRVAEIFGNPPGEYLLRLRLLDSAGRDVVSRDARITLTASRIVRVRITSDCLGVVCPGATDAPSLTECLGGHCVPPGCTGDTPELCGTPSCAVDTDCEAPVPCAEGRCIRGECLASPDDTLCEAGEYCNVTDGCAERPVEPEDAGPADAGGSDAGAGFDAGVVGFDAGPACDPASCNDFDPCTIDGCVAGSCVSTPRCGASQYCRFGVCENNPTFQLQTAVSGCADLGVAYPAGTPPLYTRTTTGRRNANAQQYNVHVSCDSVVQTAELHTLDGSGRDVLEAHTGAVSECWGDIYGRWNAYVEVDGVRSNIVDLTYYNSSCPNVRTCSAALSFCSPCRTCDLDNGYCYAGTTCAPDPTLAITTSEGGGCVDLGVAHSSPPALSFAITGRPGAVSTQINEHVSCRGPEAPAETRTLDGRGNATADVPTGVAGCVSSVYGRWNVSIDVDGERSNTREVTYFNSSCPAFNTCAEARTYCPPAS